MRASQRAIAAAQNGFRDDSTDANTLAQHVSTGPLPLPLALSYATDIAAALRQLHHQGCAHGWVNTAAVSLESGRAVLQPVNELRHASFQGDVVGFGALLLELLTGRKTGTEVPLPVVPATVSRTGAEGLRMSATRLASRCLTNDSLDMQKVVTEIRVLRVLARQLPAAALPKPVEPADSDEGEDLAPTADSFCPRCTTAAVFPSKPRTAVERWLDRLGIPLLRCHRCYHRYVLFMGMHIAKDSGEKIATGA